MTEIRLLILNLMISRFKCEDLRSFVMERHRIAAMLTIFSTFEQIPILKITASRVIENIRKSGDENVCLGLLILLFSLNYILKDIMNGIIRD